MSVFVFMLAVSIVMICEGMRREVSSDTLVMSDVKRKRAQLKTLKARSRRRKAFYWR